jgi:hypothetical protein
MALAKAHLGLGEDGPHLPHPRLIFVPKADIGNDMDQGRQTLLVTK